MLHCYHMPLGVGRGKNTCIRIRKYARCWFCCCQMHPCFWAEGSSALLWSRVVRRSSISGLSSVINFSLFLTSPLKPRNRIQTWQETRSQHPLPSLCFYPADCKNKMAVLASDWLRHFRLLLYNHWMVSAQASDWLTHFLLLLWNRWTQFNESWQKARSQST